MNNYIEVDEYSKTLEFADAVLDTLNYEDVLEIISITLNMQKEAWREKITDLLCSCKCTQQQFADRCGVSRVAVNKWCTGVLPKNRETMMIIGLAAGVEEEEMTELLQKYGRYPKLYVKDIEDCICKYVIGTFPKEERARMFCEISERMRQAIEKKDIHGSPMHTTVLEKKLSGVRNEEELERFIVKNSREFASAYHKLYTALRLEIENLKEYLGVESVNQIKNEFNWSASIKQCVSAIYNKQWYPTRKRLIMLCMCLCLEREEVDRILELAGMVPLYAKNPVEAGIIWALDMATRAGDLDRSKGKESFSPAGLVNRVIEVLAKLDSPEAKGYVEELLGMSDE